MEQTKHNDDIYSVEEDDVVEIVTSEGDVFETECKVFERQSAAEETGEVRETFIWVFDTDEGDVSAAITNGLKSSQDDPDFPDHSALWNMDEEEGLGYINEITILD